MIVLGIETSCDETGLAVYDSDKQTLLADALYSQIELHAHYGGVVPELASRDHIKKLRPLTEQVLRDARLKLRDINAVAYTSTPGLFGALMVGASYAKALAYILDIPSIGVHHLEGHLMAAFLGNQVRQVAYPFVALLISGGHTQLVAVKAFGQYETLGESMDDAAGEAFDKTAKLLGLPYPGGPNLAKLATRGRAAKFFFTRPMCDRPGLDFSFSGLKTAVMNAWQSSEQTEQDKADIAYAFEDAVVDTVITKCQRAMVQTNFQQLVIAGGVSANQHLRLALNRMSEKHDWDVIFPPLKYCTDNGVMIAIAGSHRLHAGKADISNHILVEARRKLDA